MERLCERRTHVLEVVASVPRHAVNTSM